MSFIVYGCLIYWEPEPRLVPIIIQFVVSTYVHSIQYLYRDNISAEMNAISAVSGHRQLCWTSFALELARTAQASGIPPHVAHNIIIIRINHHHRRLVTPTYLM